MGSASRQNGRSVVKLSNPRLDNSKRLIFLLNSALTNPESVQSLVRYWDRSSGPLPCQTRVTGGVRINDV